MEKKSSIQDDKLSSDYRDSKVSPDDIRTQLDRVLSSPNFKASERVKTIFRYLTEEELSGKKNSVDLHRIVAEAHSRPLDTSPSIDPIVRIQINQLRRVIKRYYTGEGATDESPRIELTEDSYTPVFHSEKE